MVVRRKEGDIPILRRLKPQYMSPSVQALALTLEERAARAARAMVEAFMLDEKCLARFRWVECWFEDARCTMWVSRLVVSTRDHFELSRWT